MNSMKLGPGLRPDVEVGPLIDADSRTALAGLVDEARDHGARTLTGGVVPETRGYFYSPTVLVDVDPTSPILEHELFGPVAPIVTFDDGDDAVRLANDRARTRRLSLHRRLGHRPRHCRTVGVWDVRDQPRDRVGSGTPFGGVKESGIGREGGQEGMREFQEPKYIALDW